MTRTALRAWAAALLVPAVLVTASTPARASWSSPSPVSLGSVSTGDVRIAEVGSPAWIRQGAAFDPSQDALRQGDELTVTVPTTVKVTGTTMRPTLDMVGAVVGPDLKGLASVAVTGDHSVAVDDGGQRVSIALRIHVSESLPTETSGVIDLTGMVIRLDSGRTWTDERALDLGHVTVRASSEHEDLLPRECADLTGTTMQVSNGLKGPWDTCVYVGEVYTSATSLKEREFTLNPFYFWASRPVWTLTFNEARSLPAKSIVQAEGSTAPLKDEPKYTHKITVNGRFTEQFFKHVVDGGDGWFALALMDPQQHNVLAAYVVGVLVNDQAVARSTGAVEEPAGVDVVGTAPGDLHRDADGDRDDLLLHRQDVAADEPRREVDVDGDSGPGLD
ncbi:hypothetical protein GCM10007967_24040 [Xylanimonas ulmi]|uniref:Uncharacterized protein n=1 Tax=Xylanimonas ulmi TaxID=228973 RepID=A0A4Q7M2Q4_9MICO|nr:hypothetical protein EV386_1026 [Xylanibacterium ulmi]